MVPWVITYLDHSDSTSDITKNQLLVYANHTLILVKTLSKNSNPTCETLIMHLNP